MQAVPAAGGGPGFRVRTQPIGYRGTLVLAAPLNDVSDTLRLVGGDDVLVRWEEKKAV